MKAKYSISPISCKVGMKSVAMVSLRGGFSLFPKINLETFVQKVLVGIQR